MKGRWPFLNSWTRSVGVKRREFSALWRSRMLPKALCLGLTCFSAMLIWWWPFNFRGGVRLIANFVTSFRSMVANLVPRSQTKHWQSWPPFTTWAGEGHCLLWMTTLLAISAMSNVSCENWFPGCNSTTIRSRLLRKLRLIWRKMMNCYNWWEKPDSMPSFLALKPQIRTASRWHANCKILVIRW